MLGDVAGHDVRAAALMGQVRAALRALALADPTPAERAARPGPAGRSPRAERRNDELFVTVVYGVVEPDGGTITLATAGHPPPVICAAAGRTASRPPPSRSTCRPGRRSGWAARRRTARRPRAGRDAPDVQRRGGRAPRSRPGRRPGRARRRRRRRRNGDPRTLCALATAAVAGTTEDDVAVLAVEHAITPSRSAGMEIPAEPTAPGRVRHWMTAQLARLAGARAGDRRGRAVRQRAGHQRAAARRHRRPGCSIDLSPERLLVSVSDSGTRGAVTRARTETLSSRGRGLGLIEELSDAWGTDPAVRGSTVWFEIALTRRESDPDRAGKAVP